MIGCLRTRVHKQPIIVLYFEFENEFKFYNLQAWLKSQLQFVAMLSSSIAWCVAMPVSLLHDGWSGLRLKDNPDVELSSVDPCLAFVFGLAHHGFSSDCPLSLFYHIILIDLIVAL